MITTRELFGVPLKQLVEEDLALGLPSGDYVPQVLKTLFRWMEEKEFVAFSNYD